MLTPPYRNALDIQRDIDNLITDITMALEAEKSALAYELYLAGNDVYEDEFSNTEIDAVQERISHMEKVRKEVRWYATMYRLYAKITQEGEK